MEVKASLAHLHQKYIHYVPIGWEITVINAGQLIDDFHATWGITAAMLRQLINRAYDPSYPGPQLVIQL